MSGLSKLSLPLRNKPFGRVLTLESSKKTMRDTSHCKLEYIPQGLEVNRYDDIAAVYGDVMGEDFANLILEPFLQTARLHLPPHRGVRYLDLACGSAALLRRVASSLSADCFGIDISHEQIKYARRKTGGRPAIHLSVGDVRCAQLPNDCDLITMNLDALNHLLQPEHWSGLFARVRGALRPGGLFWFDVNSPDRLIHDWNYPEVILKERHVFVQCPIGPPGSGYVARRQILMNIFSNDVDGIRRSTALIEQIAIPIQATAEMLRDAGFREIKVVTLSDVVRDQHIFTKNRHLVYANA